MSMSWLRANVPRGDEKEKWTRQSKRKEEQERK